MSIRLKIAEDALHRIANAEPDSGNIAEGAIMMIDALNLSVDTDVDQLLLTIQDCLFVIKKDNGEDDEETLKNVALLLADSLIGRV